MCNDKLKIGVCWRADRRINGAVELYFGVFGNKVSVVRVDYIRKKMKK